MGSYQNGLGLNQLLHTIPLRSRGEYGTSTQSTRSRIPRTYAVSGFIFQKCLIARRRRRFSGTSKLASNLFRSQTQNTAVKNARTVLAITISVRCGDDFLSGATAASTT